MKRFWNRVEAYMLVFAMCISVGNVPVYAQENNIIDVSSEAQTIDKTVIEEMTVGGTVSDNDVEAITEEDMCDVRETADANNDGMWDEVTTENVFEGENYRVTFTLTSYWNMGFNANVKIENIGDSDIQNWYLGFEYNNSIKNIWNAEVFSNADNEYIIKNVGWNKDIAVGKSIEFGISGEHAFRGFPKNYKLLGTNVELLDNDYAILYKLNSDWGTGFTGSISIKNNTDTALDDWTLEFDFNRKITEIWNGVIEEHEDSHYVIRNAEYNSNIAPGESISIGINGCGGEEDDEPFNFQLYSYVPKEDKLDNLDMEIVQNAYSKINIGYAEGDDAYSVTSNVYLCSELEGATVVWISDKPDIISDTGIVTRTNETNIVRLTAVIKSNNYSMGMDFDVRVVKNTYAEYNTDYIYDMDSLELLYIYNDDPDVLEVYLNDAGYIAELNGQFSEIIVESPEEALLALYEIKSLMGCENPKEQLVWDRTSKDNYGYSYRFHQVVDGVPVYGTSIVVSTDLSGITTALHSSFVTDLYINQGNIISESDVRAVIEENDYSFLAFEGLVVYMDNDARLTYEVNCRKQGLEYNVLVDANTGEIVFVNLLTYSDNVLIETGNDVFGVLQFFHVNEITDIFHKGNNLYSIHDFTRNIRYHDLKGSDDHSIWPGDSIIKNTNTWTAEEISAIVSMEKVYDYYYNEFGRKGSDNNRAIW